MNIIIIGSAHPLRGGGIATFNERMAYALQEQGHQVTIYSFSLQYPSFLFPGKSQRTDEPAPAGLDIRTCINSINPFNWIKTGRELRKAKPELIIVRFWMPFFGPCLGTILRGVRGNGYTRIISITDNVIPHEKRFGDLAFTRYFLKPVHAVVAMSRSVLADLKSLADKPAVYAPHPLYDNYGNVLSRDEALRFLQLDPRDRYILFFGFIRKYKGLDILLEAMKLLNAQLPDLKLIVAGEYYGDEEYYAGLIRDYGIGDKVRLFTAFIPNQDIRYYFSAADLVVQPYRTATQSGITQIAYHFEKPMVVTNVGGLAETVPDGQVGFIAEPDAASIAAAIRKFYEPGALPDFAEAVRREKQKYTWDTFLGRLLDLYKELK